MTGNGNYAKSEPVSGIWFQQLLSRKISFQKILKIGFIVETTWYIIVQYIISLLGYILSYILDS